MQMQTAHSIKTKRTKVTLMPTKQIAGIAGKVSLCVCIGHAIVLPSYGWAQESRPKHLDLAIRFVRQVAPENTSYRHKDTSVKWKGVRGAPAYESHTDCS